MPVGDIAMLIAQVLLGAALGEAVVEFLVSPILDIWEANGLDLGWKGADCGGDQAGVSARAWTTGGVA